MSELSGVLKVSNGNVTHIVDRLVADGLVERSAVPGDRRASRVRLTRKGRREFDRQASEHALWVDELLGAVSADNADLITGELETVTSSDPVDGEPLDVNYPSMTELSSDPEADRAAELVTNLAAGLAADLAAEAAAAATSIVAGPSDEKEET